MPAVKSGNNIYVEGTGNTLQSIATDIADPTFCSWDAPSSTLTIWGGVTRYLNIKNGGELTIGNPLDYSASETLAFSNAVANQLRLTVDAGATLLQYGDTMIDFFTGTQRSYYTYLYGKVTVLGNDTYKPVWQNFQRIYTFENQSSNNTYVNDIWHFEKMIFGSAAINNYYCFYIHNLGKVRAHIFKDIVFDKSYGKGFYYFPIRFVYPMDSIKNITFEGIDFHDVGSYPIYNTGARPKIKNCIFGTSLSWKMLLYGTGKNVPMTGKYDFGYNSEHEDGQAFAFVEGAVFQNIGYMNGVIAQYAGTVLMKDCDWQQTTGISLQVYYRTTILMWTGNIFSGGREAYVVNATGRIQWVYDLTLTIKGKFGNPVEGARVVIEQSEGKEKMSFVTGSNGKMINDHFLELALLTHTHQYGANKLTNMELWSDASNSTFHKVTVFKEGYIPVSRNYVMDQARVDEIYLREVNNHKIEM